MCNFSFTSGGLWNYHKPQGSFPKILVHSCSLSSSHHWSSLFGSKKPVSKEWQERKDYASTTSGSKTEKKGEEEKHVKTKTEKMVTEGLFQSMINNKEKRSPIHTKFKHQKMLEKMVEKHRRTKAREAAKQRALELGEEVCISSLSLSIPLSPSYECILFIWMLQSFMWFPIRSLLININHLE